MAFDHAATLATIPADSASAIDQLTREYARFNLAHGLNLGSADEHLNDESLPPHLRQWLARFCVRWAAAEDLEYLNAR